MKALIDAVVAKIKATAILAAFAGVGPNGQLGPFFEIAPERSAFPYLTINQVPGTSNLYGLGSTTYVEPIQLQFNLFGTGLETVAANAETFCTMFDPLTSLTLGGGQFCRKPFRKGPPRILAESIGNAGDRVYHAVIVYEFRVQRAIGT